MGYCAASDVYGLVKNLILPSGSFDANTCPTLNDVNSWISAASAVIDTELADAGYNPIPAGAAPYGIATQVSANFAAWLAENSRLSAMVQAGERTRADVFYKNWNALLTMLDKLDLSRSGVQTMNSRAYAGGISVSDKASVASDQDRVKPRFSRDFGRNPAAGFPSDNDNWRTAS